MYGRIKLTPEEVNKVITESEPVMVRHAIDGCIYATSGMTINKYDIREREYKGSYTYKKSWGMSLCNDDTRTPNLQLLFVFNGNYTIEIYDISKTKLNKHESIVKAVDEYMETEFARVVYAEKLKRSEGQDWFFNRLEFYKQAWQDKVDYTGYINYGDTNPFYKKEDIILVYDHEYFTVDHHLGYSDYEYLKAEQAIVHLEDRGYIKAEDTSFITARTPNPDPFADLDL